ncbi:MAG: endopeptidase La [Actinobacteria bacterium]|nr:endopeptidase La [Actinomycetota bacterium]
MPIEQVIPVIPLRDMVIFPNLVVPIYVGRPSSLSALEASLKSYDHKIALIAQKDAEVEKPTKDDLYEFGTLAIVLQELKLPDGTAKALVEGKHRLRIIEMVQTEPFMLARVEIIEDIPQEGVEVEALMKTVVNQFERATDLGKPIPREVVVAAINIQEAGRLADFIAFHLNLKTSERQQILEAINPYERLVKVSEFLAKEIQILEIGSKIQDRIKESMNKAQREFFLREQLKAIQEELGILDERQQEIAELREKIEKANMPEDVKNKALKELDRLAAMPQGSAEVTVVRTYLDWLVSLPWSKKDEERLDLIQARKILDEDHYGLEQVKERVLEYLAVHKLTGGKARGSILCFVGPPGVGKTSIGRSIARSLGRKFVRISLGGVHDEAEIRGHRRTYVGALPGRIIQALAQVGTKNPVFMLDEIDKVGADFRGDPSAALLEVLDPEQNYAFSDHYLEVPFDLSEVLFITTANILDTIPPALRDRMEVIHFPGYTEDEKVKIAQLYLIPKQLEANGLSSKQIKINESAIRKIIRNYTREAGVRNLEREIARICRKVAKKIVEGEVEKVSVNAKNLEEFLGPIKFRYGEAEGGEEVGIATGLAWTEAGGDILFIESTIMKGKGALILTGQLGEVMQESAKAAVSYLRANAEKLGLEPEFSDKYDIHIHVPEGAIPKDGPSAGVAIVSSLYSALSEKPVFKDIAMTGEITLRGRVLPVGGIKEKVLAAHRAGIKKVVMPKDNEKDLILVPEEVRKNLKFIFVEHIDEVFKEAIKGFKKAKAHEGKKSGREKIITK